MMHLKRFRVQNFRSVMDSGWIECDNVTSLVGVNEAGKSNIILALWKLHPARGGEIDALHDMPTKEYSSWRGIPEKITFITATFALDEEIINRVVELTRCSRKAASEVEITRRYDGKYLVTFPNFKSTITAKKIEDIAKNATKSVMDLNEKQRNEKGVKDKVLSSFNSIIEYVTGKTYLTKVDSTKIIGSFPKNLKGASTSDIMPVFTKAKEDIASTLSVLQTPDPSESSDARQLMVAEMPSFVYYSNYGNLDAQIYLPHAIKWLKGEEVKGIKNDAKVRTLRVLFDYVKLNPEEIRDLGMDPAQYVRNQYGHSIVKEPTAAEIEAATHKKAERAILLGSASADLTRRFKDWWKQGDYKFRFQADGDFFKIWVSDDKRPEEIELERRSTGLQWFLSFFLVFLVESEEAHKGAILLLDEAGLSLHPLAQKDLMTFFENLSETNPIIHTTHSPFLVNTSNIDRVKVVYVDENGQTVTSSDLRASDDKLNEKSIYAVHAALGLSVSDILLQGCQPVIVEGPSDQYYLNAIKLYLIMSQLYIPHTELVFMPTGGVRGVPGVVSIVSGKQGELPYVLLDSDQSGRDAYKKLQSGLYQHNDTLLIEVGTFLSFENGEVEDLIPTSLMGRYLNRLFKDIEDFEFEDQFKESQPIIPQIETFAGEHNVPLPKGWKVEMAKAVKQQLLKTKKGTIPDLFITKWKTLFEKF